MEIYYEKYGQGYPIFCLHGNQENRKIYYPLTKDLTDYQLILVDSRYHGKSIKQGELSLNQMALDIQAICEMENIKAYDVIGFSDGANIALTLAMQDQRLKNMVLLSPNSHPKALKAFYRFMMRLQMVVLLPFCIYQKRARRMYRLTRWMFQEPHFTKEQLQKIQQPTLLLFGERDMIKKEDFSFIQSSLPHCIQEEIKNSSHFMWDDAYPLVYKKIRGFLYACHESQGVSND